MYLTRAHVGCLLRLMLGHTYSKRMTTARHCGLVYPSGQMQYGIRDKYEILVYQQVSKEVLCICCFHLHTSVAR